MLYKIVIQFFNNSYINQYNISKFKMRFKLHENVKKLKYSTHNLIEIHSDLSALSAQTKISE